MSLYGSWLQSFGTSARENTSGVQIRRLVRLLILDALLLAGLAIGTALGVSRLIQYFGSKFGIPPTMARITVVAAAIGLALPLLAGVARLARQLGLVLALRALPVVDGAAPDLATAPRRALLLTIQLGIVLLIGLPLLAVTQPFLGGVYAPLLFAALLLALGVSLWREPRSCTAMFAPAPRRSWRRSSLKRARVGANRLRLGASRNKIPLAQVRTLLPGMGDPTLLELDILSPAVGKSLAELNLRGANWRHRAGHPTGARWLTGPDCERSTAGWRSLGIGWHARRDGGSQAVAPPDGRGLNRRLGAWIFQMSRAEVLRRGLSGRRSATRRQLG